MSFNIGDKVDCWHIGDKTFIVSRGIIVTGINEYGDPLVHTTWVAPGYNFDFRREVGQESYIARTHLSLVSPLELLAECAE